MDEIIEKKTGWKCLVPQIYASSVAMSAHFLLATSLAFPTFLIPALESPDSDIQVTISQSNWTATISTLVSTISMVLFNGLLINYFGCINTLKMTAIPGILGWVVTALARDIHVLLLGRFLTGLGAAHIAVSLVYTSEITRPDIRASVLNIHTGYISGGMVMVHILGYFLHWRTLAWVNIIFVVLPTILLMSLPESPTWLIYHRKPHEAKVALKRLNKYYPDPIEETEKQFEVLMQNYRKRTSENSNKNNVKEVVKQFLEPTGYKPIFVTAGLFFFQELTGIYIVLIHTIIFFQNIEINIDVNIIPAILGSVRFVMNMVVICIMKYFNVRTLLLSSTAGMGACMLLSGLFTKWIQEGTTTLTWSPLFLIMLYITFAIFGVIPVPWFITAELFPTKIRGYGQGFTSAIGHCFMSLALQNYRYLEALLGGTRNLQFFFSAMAVLSLVFTWFFLPETHNKQLVEIEEYFENNWIYKKEKKRVAINKELEEFTSSE